MVSSATMIPNNDLAARLTNINLKSLAHNIDDFIARASKNHWPAKTVLDELCNIEINERSRLSLERRLRFQCDSPMLRRRRLQAYATPNLLVIDELAYLSYDDNAADLLYEVVNQRYERRSIIITTNREFNEWNQVFPNATSITALLDRLTHHADITAIEGDSYRVHESKLESDLRRKVKK